MSLGKRDSRPFYFLLVLSILVMGLSQFETQAKERAGTSKQKVKRQRPQKTISIFSLGGGYTIWNESLSGTDAGLNDSGIANYAGLFLMADQMWIRGRVVYNGTLGFGTGKATATGFDQVGYSDSGQRQWTLGYLQGSLLYRTSTYIMLGGGLFGSYRTADWSSATNSDLTIKEKDTFLYGPELSARLMIKRNFIMTQTYATLGASHRSLWRWGVLYAF